MEVEAYAGMTEWMSAWHSVDAFTTGPYLQQRLNGGHDGQVGGHQREKGDPGGRGAQLALPPPPPAVTFLNRLSENQHCSIQTCGSLCTT